MKTHVRCRHCGSRRKLAKHPDAYRLQPKCLCGARDWRKDEYRHRVELPQMRLKIGRYAVCHSCFHYPHRIGSEGCIFHADGSYRYFFASRLPSPLDIVIICFLLTGATEMRWIKTEERSPKQMQWVVIHWNGVFKVGQFDAKHPFGPVVIDHMLGKWWNGFSHWAPLSTPKA